MKALNFNTNHRRGLIRLQKKVKFMDFNLLNSIDLAIAIIFVPLSVAFVVGGDVGREDNWS
jgi:hypothetical protein